MTNERQKLEWAQVYVLGGGLILTMLTSVVGVWVHFDNRLDSLELKSSLLLDADSNVKPSEKAVQAIYMLEAIYDRMQRLEKMHEPGHPHMH